MLTIEQPASIRKGLAATTQEPLESSDTPPSTDSPQPQASSSNLPQISPPVFDLSDIPTPSSTVPTLTPITRPPSPPVLPPSQSLVTFTTQTQQQPPVTSTRTTPTMTTAHMPSRGERAAPTFDKAKPRKLPRFFQELEYLFARANITSDSEKKDHVLRYVEFEIEQIWKTFPEYKNGIKTYSDFKDAILVHYPDASGDYVYSLHDMDLLIGERQRLGIATSQDLSDYHLQFIAITAWLIDKKQLGTLEQERAYLRAFQAPLLNAIMTRLQVIKLNHHPNIPHAVKEVYEAARFILQSTSTSTQGYFAPLPNAYAPLAPIASPEPAIKTESLGSILSEFTKTILEAINHQQNHQHNHSGHRHASSSNGPMVNCNFCDGPHYVRNCPDVLEYIKQGRCKRNIEGKIVLPTGAFVPREIPGTLLRDRIDEWHKRNPNQLAAASLINTIDARIINQCPSTTLQTYQLSTQDRIATLEAELFNLRTRKPPATQSQIRTRSQKARVADPEDSDAEEVAAIRRDNRAHIEEVPEDTTPPQVTPQPITKSDPPTASTSNPQQTQEPEHPYRNVKDATYQPPTERNIDVPVKPPARRPEPAYKMLPPVHDPVIAADVYKRSMEAPITITQRELLSLSPEVRSQVRDATTTKRIPHKEPIIAQTFYENQDNSQMYDESPVDILAYDIQRKPPAGSFIVSDPIENYYKMLKPGEDPDFTYLLVAKDSSAVRSVIALVDNTQKVECILDPGCQIVAMSENICHELGLAYDPSIKLNMQSANGNIDQSLGLSRNVPFKIHTITVYMQVHVIRSPAYDILLGRPFDILTESVVRNFANEDQTITIHNPNTDARATIPTIPRGPVKCKHHHLRGCQDFRRTGA